MESSHQKLSAGSSNERGDHRSLGRALNIGRPWGTIDDQEYP